MRGDRRTITTLTLLYAAAAVVGHGWHKLAGIECHHNVVCIDGHDGCHHCICDASPVRDAAAWSALPIIAAASPNHDRFACPICHALSQFSTLAENAGVIPSGLLQSPPEQTVAETYFSTWPRVWSPRAPPA